MGGQRGFIRTLRRAEHAGRAKAPRLLQRVSMGPGLREGDDDSGWPVASGDGSALAFVSEATNLVRDDMNCTFDVFVVRLAPCLP